MNKQEIYSAMRITEATGWTGTVSLLSALFVGFVMPQFIVTGALLWIFGFVTWAFSDFRFAMTLSRFGGINQDAKKWFKVCVYSGFIWIGAMLWTIINFGIVLNSVIGILLLLGIAWCSLKEIDYRKNIFPVIYH